MKYLLVILGGTILLFIAVVTGPMPTAHGPSGSLICRDAASQIGPVLSSWRNNGTIRERTSNEVTVDEYRWNDAPHNAKVSIAIAGFCDAHPDSTGSYFVMGYRNGKILASVENGNYFEN